MKNAIQERLDQSLQDGREQKDILLWFKDKGRVVNQGFLNRVIRGEQSPPAWMMFGIARYFGKQIEDIFFPSEEDIFGGKE